MEMWLHDIGFSSFLDLFLEIMESENGLKPSQGARKAFFFGIRKVLKDSEDPLKILEEVDPVILMNFAKDVGFELTSKQSMLEEVANLFLDGSEEEVDLDTVSAEEVDQEVPETGDIPGWLEEFRNDPEPEESLEDIEGFLEGLDESGVDLQGHADGSDQIHQVPAEQAWPRGLEWSAVSFIYSMWGGRIKMWEQAKRRHQVLFLLEKLDRSRNPHRLLRKLGSDLHMLLDQLGVQRRTGVSNFRFRNEAIDALERDLRSKAQYLNLDVPSEWPGTGFQRFRSWVLRSWWKVILGLGFTALILGAALLTVSFFCGLTGSC